MGGCRTGPGRGRDRAAEPTAPPCLPGCGGGSRRCGIPAPHAPSIRPGAVGIRRGPAARSGNPLVGAAAPPVGSRRSLGGILMIIGRLLRRESTSRAKTRPRGCAVAEAVPHRAPEPGRHADGRIEYRARRRAPAGGSSCARSDSRVEPAGAASHTLRPVFCNVRDGRDRRPRAAGQVRLRARRWARGWLGWVVGPGASSGGSRGIRSAAALLRRGSRMTKQPTYLGSVAVSTGEP